jgi:hypothetical protein
MLLRFIVDPCGTVISVREWRACSVVWCFRKYFPFPVWAMIDEEVEKWSRFPGLRFGKGQ